MRNQHWECGNVIPYAHGIYRFVREDDCCGGKFILTHQPTSLLGNMYVSSLRLNKEKHRLFNPLATVSECLSFTRHANFMSGIFLYFFTRLNRPASPDSMGSIKLLYQKPY